MKTEQMRATLAKLFPAPPGYMPDPDALNLKGQVPPIATSPAPRVVHPRPIRTYYYESVNDSVDSWARRSRASTIEGAVRAAIMRVLQRTAAHVDFYHEDGHRIGWIRREPRSKKITVMVL